MQLEESRRNRVEERSPKEIPLRHIFRFSARMRNITLILDAMQRGEQHAADELLPAVYAELRRLAASKLTRERPGQTLQPTALVHEAWLRLGAEARFENRGHFFRGGGGDAPYPDRWRARRKLAMRRGAREERVDVADVEIAAPSLDNEMLAIHEALDSWRGRMHRRRSW